MARFRRFDLILLSMLLASLVARLAYVYLRVTEDPTFGRPTLDSAYYLDWARAIAAGAGGPTGAFYLAPLYPYVLALFTLAFGENLALLYCAQQVLVVAAAGLMALTGRRLMGETAGLTAAALMLLYHPLMFFAGRVIGEPLAIALLSLSIYLISRPSNRSAGAAGWVAGIAALARPNLLLVPLAWAAVEAWHRRWWRAGLLVAGVGLAVLPTAVHNTLESGHLVLISSNGGMTLYIGNAPGAEKSGTQRPPGSIGGVATVRDDATRMANLLSGREMDAVEADQWWARRAVEARLDDPIGTVKLFGIRLAQLISNAEISLAMAPAMDTNLLRWLAPYPVCLLIGLAFGGVVALGFRETGGPIAWVAILACAVMPIAFYVSSRYRLPVMALLCLPAGAGLNALASGKHGLGSLRMQIGLVAGGVAIAASLAVPVDGAKTGAVSALIERSVAYRAKGDTARAEALLRDGVERHPRAAHPWISLGDLLHDEARYPEAEEAFRRALAIQPGSADASGQLGALLLELNRPAEAVPLLERYLNTYPSHPVAWNSLVLSLLKTGDMEKAHRAAALASERGVRLEQVLVDLLEGG